MPTQVVPYGSNTDGGISISLEDLRPPPEYSAEWAQVAYGTICAADRDKSGQLSKGELWKVLEIIPLRVESLRPKPDKSGTTNANQKKAFTLLQAADLDNSGSLDPTEVIAALAELDTQQATNKDLKKDKVRLFKLLVVALCVVIALLAAVGGLMAAWVVEASKDTAVGTCGAMTVKGSLEPVAVNDVAMSISLFEYPLLSDRDLVRALKAPIAVSDEITMKSMMLSVSGFDRDFESTGARSGSGATLVLRL